MTETEMANTGLVLSILQIVYPMLSTIVKNTKGAIAKHEQKNSVQDFVRLAQGLTTIDKTYLLKQLRSSSELHEALNKANTREEFSQAMSVLRTAFDTPETAAQIDQLAVDLEAKTFAQSATPPLQILRSDSFRVEGKIDALDAKLARHQEITSQLESALKFQINPLAATRDVLQKRYPDLLGFHLYQVNVITDL
jgi:hypothetical protein